MTSVERKLLETYRKRLSAALADAEDAQERIEKFAPLIRSLEVVLGDSDNDSTFARAMAMESRAARNAFVHGHRPAEGTPRGEAAVARFLQEHPGQEFSPAILTEWLSRIGWIGDEVTDPIAATRAAANRLRKKHPDDYRFEDGVYSYVGEPSSTLKDDARLGGHLFVPRRVSPADEELALLAEHPEDRDDV